MIKMLIIVAGMIITWQSASSVETINVYRDYILAALLTVLIQPWVKRQIDE